MQILLKISGIILIVASILTMWDITVWLMTPIKEMWQAPIFNIHILFKFIGRFIISIIVIIIIIFILLLGFELMNK